MANKMLYFNQNPEFASLYLWVGKMIIMTSSIDSVDRFVQERRNSSVLAIELRLSCTKPPVC